MGSLIWANTIQVRSAGSCATLRTGFLNETKKMCNNWEQKESSLFHPIEDQRHCDDTRLFKAARSPSETNFTVNSSEVWCKISWQDIKSIYIVFVWTYLISDRANIYGFSHHIYGWAPWKCSKSLVCTADRRRNDQRSWQHDILV